MIGKKGYCSKCGQKLPQGSDICLNCKSSSNEKKSVENHSNEEKMNEKIVSEKNISDDYANDILKRVSGDLYNFNFIKKCTEALPSENYWQNVVKILVIYFNSNCSQIVEQNRKNNSKKFSRLGLVVVLLFLSPIISLFIGSGFQQTTPTVDEHAMALNSIETSIIFWFCFVLALIVIYVTSVIVRHSFCKKQYNDLIHYLLAQIQVLQVSQEMLQNMIRVNPEFAILCRKANLLE